MNMCTASDGERNMVMLEKVDGNYQGATYPGGHAERGETFIESTGREVREETGLEVEAPKLCGIYHWCCDNVHHVIYIYPAGKYIGELRSSAEGKVSWIPEEDFQKKELAPRMEAVLKLIHDDTLSECYLWNEVAVGKSGYRYRLW